MAKFFNHSQRHCACLPKAFNIQFFHRVLRRVHPPRGAAKRDERKRVETNFGKGEVVEQRADEVETAQREAHFAAGGADQAQESCPRPLPSLTHKT